MRGCHFPRSRADNHHNAEQAGNSFFLKIGTFCSKQAVCKTSVERHVNLRLRCILMFLFDMSSSRQIIWRFWESSNCTSRLKRRRQLIEAAHNRWNKNNTKKNNGANPEKRKRSLETGDETIPIPINQPTDHGFLRKKTGAGCCYRSYTAVHTKDV